MLGKYPKLYEAMAKRHQVYNEETKYVFEEESKGNVFVLCPKESLGISRTEKDKKELQRIYDEGRSLASQKLSQIKDFLQK